MENSTGKISFGFSKVTKKSNIIKSSTASAESSKKIQLIESIEGSEVKVYG
jgi:hypothetical protein